MLPQKLHGPYFKSTQHQSGAEEGVGTALHPSDDDHCPLRSTNLNHEPQDLLLCMEYFPSNLGATSGRPQEAAAPLQVSWTANLTQLQRSTRALLDGSSNVTQPVLISPVSPRHPRANHPLLAAIVVLMVLATVALFCCCYLWERQLRLRIEATRSSTHSLQDPVGDNHSSRPQMGSSPSVIVLLGDDVTRSVAWAVPRRISTAVVSEASIQPTPTNADQSLRKLTTN